MSDGKICGGGPLNENVRLDLPSCLSRLFHHHLADLHQDSMRFDPTRTSSVVLSSSFDTADKLTMFSRASDTKLMKAGEANSKARVTSKMRCPRKDRRIGSEDEV